VTVQVDGGAAHTDAEIQAGQAAADDIAKAAGAATITSAATNSA